MKTIKLTILFLFVPLIFFAQSLTGLWTGTLTNDSNTIRREQSFEIVLTQYKDKVYGYSRMTFLVHDTLYYIVKRVKGTVEAEICEVKDDGIISHNFPRKPEKGVKLSSTFRRNKQDSTWYLDGDWKTNKTKKYYSVSGKVALAQEKDLGKSKIFPHLEELSLADDVAFYKESKKAPEPVAVVNQPVKNTKKEPVTKDTNGPVSSNKETNTKGLAQTKQPADNVKKDKQDPEEKPVVTPVKENIKDPVAFVPAKPGQAEQTKQSINNVKKDQPVIEEKPVTATVKNNGAGNQAAIQPKSSPAREINQPANDNKKDLVIKEEKVPEPGKSEPVAVTKPVEQKKEPVTQSINTETKKQEAASAAIVSEEKNKQQPVTIIPENKPAIPTAAALVAERKIAPPQVVIFQSDSLELALYDNGEVDGDTVSVLLNGEVILARQGLKTSAIKKTIYVPAGTNDSMTLVLYAENLGKYPPNTGLLIVHDGDDVIQIRFSADLLQNAAVIFKRKRN